MKQEILEFNKLCAEFLGWKNLNDDSFPEYVDKLGNFYPLKELNFHSDWNWIMEVVEAIEKIEIEEATKETPSRELNRVLGRVLDLPIYTKKETVIQAINQFLIWYNENKTN